MFPFAGQADGQVRRLRRQDCSLRASLKDGKEKTKRTFYVDDFLRYKTAKWSCLETSVARGITESSSSSSC